jgi:hypothetical protein
MEEGGVRDLVMNEPGCGEGPFPRAETKSEKKGRMHWEGTVRGDKIDVHYVWTDKSHWYKPNPKPLEKWAKGELKKSE